MTKELNQLLNALKIDRRTLTDKQIAKAQRTLDKIVKESYAEGGDAVYRAVYGKSALFKCDNGYSDMAMANTVYKSFSNTNIEPMLKIAIEAMKKDFILYHNQLLTKSSNMADSPYRDQEEKELLLQYIETIKKNISIASSMPY